MSRRIRRWFAPSLIFLAASLSARAGASGPKGPSDPAAIEVRVSPAATATGAERVVSVRLTPVAGVKINRYPKIKLKIDAQPGLVAAAEASVGSAEPPPPDQIESNYFATVDPVELPLRLDPRAGTGAHEVKGQLTYYYCVAASGFCAPKRVSLTIPLTVN